MDPESQSPSHHVVDTVVNATPEKRTGRKSMSRRSGQNGCIQEDVTGTSFDPRIGPITVRGIHIILRVAFILRFSLESPA
jgi:hypothetical protein